MHSRYMTINLDKEVYGPGETIIASFQVPSDLPSRLREVEFIIEIIEKVGVEYTKHVSSSNGSSTRRAWANEETYIARAIEIIDPTKAVGEHKMSLTLPHQLPGMINIRTDDIKVEIIARAEIKWDRKFGIDKHEYKEFRIIPNIPSGTPVNTEHEGLIISIKDNVIYADDNLRIKINKDPSFDEGYSNVRVEIETEINANARGKSERDVDLAQVLAQFDDLPGGMLEITVPQLSQASCRGNKFNINHNLKVVLDKRLRMDTNLVLPIYYINAPRKAVEVIQVSSTTAPIVDGMHTGSVEQNDDESYNTAYDEPMFSSKPLEKTCINCGSGYIGNRCEHCGKKY